MYTLRSIGFLMCMLASAQACHPRFMVSARAVVSRPASIVSRASSGSIALSGTVIRTGSTASVAGSVATASKLAEAATKLEKIAGYGGGLMVASAAGAGINKLIGGSAPILNETHVHIAELNVLYGPSVIANSSLPMAQIGKAINSSISVALEKSVSPTVSMIKKVELPAIEDDIPEVNAVDNCLIKFKYETDKATFVMYIVGGLGLIIIAMTFVLIIWCSLLYYKRAALNRCKANANKISKFPSKCSFVAETA